jgi:hypothetical protein
MSEEQKTHREVKKPQMSGRLLSDFMAASESGKRTIVRGCKYQPIARLIQHDEAKMSVGKFFRAGWIDTGPMLEDAQRLRNQMADSPFDRDVLDHNADYIERFVSVSGNVTLPTADIEPPGRTPAIDLGGVRVTAEIQFRLRRVMARTNRVRIGAGTLRYAKGVRLGVSAAMWQSAFLFGYLNLTKTDPDAEPEHKLCLTIDAYAGKAHGAPTDAVRRFHNMEAACTTIAEWWPNIKPPPGAVL